MNELEEVRSDLKEEGARVDRLELLVAHLEARAGTIEARATDLGERVDAIEQVAMFFKRVGARSSGAIDFGRRVAGAVTAAVRGELAGGSQKALHEMLDDRMTRPPILLPLHQATCAVDPRDLGAARYRVLHQMLLIGWPVPRIATVEECEVARAVSPTDAALLRAVREFVEDPQKQLELWTQLKAPKA